MSVDGRVINWVINQVNSKANVYSVERLKGSTSSTLHLIKIRMDLEEREVVLRQFDNREWLKEEPDLALHEAESLSRATRVNMSTPEIIAYDEKGVVNGIPMVLMSKVDGTVKLNVPDRKLLLKGLADTLVRIHEVDGRDFPYDYFSYRQGEEINIPSWTSVPEAWGKAISLLEDSPPIDKDCFIHRDFHPTNVLWENGEVSGVVDWVNACRGPAGVDVGHCRVNLAMLYGVTVADEFLKAYMDRAGTPFDYKPYWDFISLYDILDGQPSVYPGWAAFGVTDLTEDMIVNRLDKYIESLIGKV